MNQDKNCYMCKTVKAVSFFGKDKSRKDGLNNRCKACDSKSRKFRPRDRRLHLLHVKRHYLKNRERILARYKAWDLKNKKKRLAHYAVNRAIKFGKLTKKNCETCENGQAQAHHNDYNFPLSVTWLCRSCHGKWHSSNKPIM